MAVTEQQAMIREMARNFAAEKLAPNSAEWDRTARFPAEAIAEMGALGFMGMLVPEAWGGAGVDHVAYVMAVEEIAAGDASCSTVMAVHNSLGCLPLLKFGNDTPKKRFLRSMASGQTIPCF